MKLILHGAIAWLFSQLPLSALAADIAGDVQSALNLNQDGGYFELGVTGGYFHYPYLVDEELLESDQAFATIDGSAVFRKNGFFVEGVQGTNDGINLGYTVFQNNRWSFDILGASAHGLYETDRDERIRSGDNEATRNEKLLNRNTLYVGSGVRLTSYFNKYVVQYRLVTDTLGSNGLASSLRVGRGWQIWNWNLFTIISADYTSKKTNNFYYQVEPHEATTRFPTYEADSSLGYGIQFGVVKPLSEKWLMRIYGGWLQSPDEMRDSPLTEDSDTTYIAFAINRVFSWGH